LQLLILDLSRRTSSATRKITKYWIHFENKDLRLTLTSGPLEKRDRAQKNAKRIRKTCSRPLRKRKSGTQIFLTRNPRNARAEKISKDALRDGRQRMSA